MAKARKSGTRKRTMRKGCQKKRCASKTRPGRLDYVTHKGSKYYNRQGHRQTRNAKGVKGRPYMRRKTAKKSKKSKKKKASKKSMFQQILGM